jgi:hypothetical protein
MVNAKTLSSMIRSFTEAFSFNHSASENPENWSGKKLNKWFHKVEWRLEWNIIPDESINKTELAIQFFKMLSEQLIKILNHETPDSLCVDMGQVARQGMVQQRCII